VIRDTVLAGEESAARRGMGRAGATQTGISRSVADTSSKMRYDDYLRALEGRKGLFDVGRGISDLSKKTLISLVFQGPKKI
jgi:hypothetical protein